MYPQATWSQKKKLFSPLIQPQGITKDKRSVRGHMLSATPRSLISVETAVQRLPIHAEPLLQQWVIILLESFFFACFFFNCCHCKQTLSTYTYAAVLYDASNNKTMGHFPNIIQVSILIIRMRSNLFSYWILLRQVSFLLHLSHELLPSASICSN